MHVDDDREHKVVDLPKVRIELRRHRRYLAALKVRQKENPDLTISGWMREAMDQLAERDLR